MRLTIALLVAALNLSQAAVLHTPPKGFLDANPDAHVHTDAFFVTFTSPAGSAKATQEQAAFRSQMKRLGIKYKERHAFNTLINAMSFEMDAAYLDKVYAIAAIRDVFPLVSRRPPKVIIRKADPKLRFAHGITGVATVHDTLGFTGKGVKVGIIDSGIDYKHPALGGCFGPGCKVAGGYDFVGDDYTGANSPVPDEDPRDCNNGKGGGHGTHVAGIVGARDKDFVGVAPDVTLHAYRVFGCDGSTGTDIMVAAMERAYKDGCDAINMSIGGGSSWAQYPDSVVADALVGKGMAVFSAMGNDGDKGMFQAESPGLARRGFGVASFDNVKFMAYSFKIDGENKELAYANGDEKVFLDYKGAEVVSAFLGDNDLACKPLTGLDLTGKIALVQRGDCLFKDKVVNCQNANAKAVLIYNKQFGAFAPAYEPGEANIPVVGTEQANGQYILGLLKKGKVTLSFNTVKAPFDNPTGGKVSDYSSWGPGPELDAKPDVGAPGGLILSTWPLAMGGYNTISGTSMATPYTAGVAALYIQAKNLSGRKFDPVTVRDIFRNTAKPAQNWDGKDTAPVFRQGAGLINAKDAITTTTFALPSVISLNSTDIAGTEQEHKITIKNTAKTAMVYTFDHKPASAVQSWDNKTGEIAAIPELKTAPSKVTFDVKRLRIPAGATRDVRVTISPNSGLPYAEKWLYSGYIVISPVQRGSKSADYDGTRGIDWAAAAKQTEIYVPYSGFNGAYRSLKVMSNPSTGFPSLTYGANQTVISPNSTAATFSLKDADQPVINLRLIHPCRRLLVRAVNEKGKEIGLIDGGENLWLGQNDHTPENLLYQLPWTGKYVPDGPNVAEGDVPTTDPKTKAEPKDAPDGKYKLRILALRPFNSGKTRRGYEQWESPLFVINRAAAVQPPPKSNDGNLLPKGKTLSRVLEALKQQGAEQRRKAEQLAQDSMLPKRVVIPVVRQ